MRGLQRGLSLIELMVFLVVVGMALAGVLQVYNQAVRHSADPILRKQALAIAESLLSEAMMRPFTYCDPDDPVHDPSATPPSSGASCTAGMDQNNSGNPLTAVPAGETRYSSSNPFDNVADYNGFAMASGIYSIDDGGTPISALSNYSATVSVTRTGTSFGLANEEALLIQVDVQIGNETISVSGVRFRYAPLSTG